jgi:chemotaxis protein CheC
VNETDLTSWADLVGLGTRNAMTGLSQMIGRDIEVSEFSLRRVPVTELASLVGGRDQDAVGIYLTVTGAADGHLMLIYEPRIAYAFVDLLMMQEPETTTGLGDMERSALAEMGNIIGAFFLNAIADSTGLSLSPSPPEVMTDMAGALLDVVSADILLTQDETYLAETTFDVSDREVSGVFLVMPSEELLQTLLEQAHAA